MYRFALSPRWLLFHLVVIAAVVAMINLGFWQLRRLEERRDLNDIVAARYDEAPVALDPLLDAAEDDLATIEWRPVVVRGEFIRDEELRVVNRSQNGSAGDNIVVPLLLDDGRVLLVNRGFVPLSVDEAELAPTPSGEVTVTGRVHPSQERRRGQSSDPADGDLRVAQRIDIDRLAPQLPAPPIDVYIDQFSVTPAPANSSARFPEPVVAPEPGDGSHLGYAVQWFVFSACAPIGWVLAMRHSAAQRRLENNRVPSTA